MASRINLESSNAAAIRGAVASECNLRDGAKRAGEDEGAMFRYFVATIGRDDVAGKPVGIERVASVASAEALSCPNVRANVIAATVACFAIVDRDAR